MVRVESVRTSTCSIRKTRKSVFFMSSNFTAILGLGNVLGNAELIRAAKELHLEGIIAKRKDSFTNPDDITVLG